MCTQPLTSGHRCLLCYDLVWAGGPQAPALPKGGLLCAVGRAGGMGAGLMVVAIAVRWKGRPAAVTVVRVQLDSALLSFFADPMARLLFASHLWNRNNSPTAKLCYLLENRCGLILNIAAPCRAVGERVCARSARHAGWSPLIVAWDLVI